MTTTRAPVPGGGLRRRGARGARGAVRRGAGSSRRARLGGVGSRLLGAARRRLVLPVLVAGAGVGCGPGPESLGGPLPERRLSAPALPEDPLAALLAEPEGHTGVVVRETQLLIPAPYDGRLVERFVTPGESVPVGAPLGRFETDALQRRLEVALADVHEAEASRAAARVELEQARSRNERRQGRQELFSTEQLNDFLAAVEVADAQLEAAEARLEHAVSVEQEARAALSKATLRAPVAGVVTEVHGLGAHYAQGATVFAVGAGEWRVRFAAEPEAVSSLIPGAALRIQPTEGGDPRPGIVLVVSPVLDARSMLVHAEATLCDDRVLPAGLPVRVSAPPDWVADDRQFVACRESHREFLDLPEPAAAAPAPAPAPSSSSPPSSSPFPSPSPSPGD